MVDGRQGLNGGSSSPVFIHVDPFGTVWLLLQQRGSASGAIVHEESARFAANPVALMDLVCSPFSQRTAFSVGMAARRDREH